MEKLKIIQEQYQNIKSFELEKLGAGFLEGVSRGFSSDNPLFKYLDYLKYELIPFLCKANGPFDLKAVAVVNNDPGLILCVIFSVLDASDRRHPRETRVDIIKCYLALKELVDDPLLILKK